jgi:hypothetical protein
MHLTSVARGALLPAILLAASCGPSPEPSAPAAEAPTPAPVATPAAPAEVPQAWLIDVESMTPEERLAVLALQGIANRQGPRVFLQTGQAIRWNQIDYDRDDGDKGGRQWSQEAADMLRTRYRNTCDYWIEYIESIGMARFKKAGVGDLLKELGDEVKGFVVYDKLDHDLSIAATMAGLDDLVPVTPALRDRLELDAGRSLPVKFDVRKLKAGYPSGSDPRIEAHRWAIANLLPRCDRSAALSRDKTYGQDAHDILIDADLAIRNRWFVFDLTYMSEETRLGKNDKPDPVWGFEPPDEELLVQILESLDQPYPPIYGWGRPYESALIRRLAINGGVKICTGNGNASFFQSMPVQSESFRQPVPHAQTVTPEDKIYVSFAVNEGDTLKYLTGLANGGGWLQPQRGTIPINWGMDPLLYVKFPGLVSHYYRTATPNDYFFSAPSGWGYLAPFMLPTKQIPVYGDLVRRGGELADLRYIDVWWMSGLRERGQFFPFLSAMGMRGLTQWSDRQEVEFAPDGTPVIHSNLYYARYRPEVLAAKIRTVGEQMGAPWFVFVYGGNPHWFSEIARHLPPDRFKVVKMDEFFEAARLARPKLEGRVFRAKPDEITEAP